LACSAASSTAGAQAATVAAVALPPARQRVSNVDALLGLAETAAAAPCSTDSAPPFVSAGGVAAA
jgi:hypothetical protein